MAVLYIVKKSVSLWRYTSNGPFRLVAIDRDRYRDQVHRTQWESAVVICLCALYNQVYRTQWESVLSCLCVSVEQGIQYSMGICVVHHVSVQYEHVCTSIQNSMGHLCCYLSLCSMNKYTELNGNLCCYLSLCSMNKYTVLNGNLCCHLSLCSVSISTQFYTSHFLSVSVSVSVSSVNTP